MNHRWYVVNVNTHCNLRRSMFYWLHWNAYFVKVIEHSKVISNVVPPPPVDGIFPLIIIIDRIYCQRIQFQSTFSSIDWNTPTTNFIFLLKFFCCCWRKRRIQWLVTIRYTYRRDFFIHWFVLMRIFPIRIKERWTRTLMWRLSFRLSTVGFK